MIRNPRHFPCRQTPSCARTRSYVPHLIDIRSIQNEANKHYKRQLHIRATKNIPNDKTFQVLIYEDSRKILYVYSRKLKATRCTLRCERRDTRKMDANRDRFQKYFNCEERNRRRIGGAQQSTTFVYTYFMQKTSLT